MTGTVKKTMRTAHVEQIELINFTELLLVLKWTRQSNFSEGTSRSKADGWNLKNHSHLIFARHLRKKTHFQLIDGDSRGKVRNEESAVQH